MGKALAVEVVISRGSEAVWAAMTDWDKAHEWMPGIDSMQAHGETAPGTAITFHARGKERASEIVHCEPGRSVVLRSTQGGVTADYTYEVHRVDDENTKVTLVATCNTKGFGWGLISPLIRLGMRLSDRRQLPALKQLMEGP